ncbi:MAG TPA: EAL domain-containing protein [Pseudomonadales bacterium]
MAATTIALLELNNAGEVFAELGQNAMELFLEEFRNRTLRFLRSDDELIEVQPTKLCLLLKNVTDRVQIELAGAKLHRLFDPPFSIADEEVNARVHTAFVPPGASSEDSRNRLRVAESGLNEARRQNRFFVIQEYPATNHVASFRRYREIERAFERGEFVMYFQPLVDSCHRKVVSGEALMRWHDPQLGVRSPDQFIPYLERSAILKSLTWFALKSAVAQAARWPSETTVAVNVSPMLLHDDELIPHVADALSIFGLAPQRLTLEITEDAVVEDPRGAIEVLSRLREIGVQIAIDDFGTGYSSLAAFRELPVDTLKIDRSFVANMVDHPRDNDIVRAIIDLAHALSMKVVAEGVEDLNTAAALQGLGADVLQGFWFGMPMTAAEFEQLLG